MLAFVNSKKNLTAFSLIELLAVLSILSVCFYLGSHLYSLFRSQHQQRVFLKNFTVLLEYSQSLAWSSGMPLYLSMTGSGVDLSDACLNLQSKAHIDIAPADSTLTWEGFVPGECFAIYPDFHESVRNGRFIYQSKSPPLFRYDIIMNRVGRVKVVSIL